jgi:hypothetical protein
MAIDDGSSSPQVLAKRDHEGDVDMGDFSSENVSWADVAFLSLCDTWPKLVD